MQLATPDISQEYCHCANLLVIYDINLLHQYDLWVCVLLSFIVNDRFVAADVEQASVAAPPATSQNDGA
jgi:hypothetical protein